MKRGIKKRRGRPSLILPVVIYNGKKKWNVPTKFADLLDVPPGLLRFAMNFEYLLVDLNDLDESDIQGSLEVVLGTRLLKNHDESSKLNTWKETIEQFAEELKGLPERERIEELIPFIMYTLATSDVKKDQIEAILEKALEPKEKNIMPTLQKIFRREFRNGKIEGEIKGKIEGKIEGEIKGKIAVISDLLEAEFGAEGLRIAERIGKLNDLEKIDKIQKFVVRTKNLRSIEKFLQELD